MHLSVCLKTALMKVSRICLCTGSLLVGSFLATSAWGQSEPTPVSASAGLKDLLPADPPDVLLDTLNGLPASWKSWADSATGELSAFYGATPGDIAGQRAVLARLKERLGTIDRSLSMSQYQPIWIQLRGLRWGLLKRIELLEAVLDTLSDHQTKSFAQSARQRLLESLGSVEAFLDSGVSGDAGWKTYLRTDQVRGHLLTGADNLTLLTSLTKSQHNLRFAQKWNDPAVQEFSSNPTLKNYLRDLDVAVAALERETSGVRWNDIRTEFKRLIGELETYEEDQLRSSAGQVRTAFDKLRELAPDGGDRLARVLRQHFFNSNFQASISEGFLNRMMDKSRVESGAVRDFILGADVYGSQTTASRSTVDLVPASSNAHLQIQLNGEVSNNTEAFASRATIYSVGSNQFFGIKDVFFDGSSFSTAPATVNATASNTPVGASTKADGIPIFAGIARRIAIRSANRSRPESEAIAAQHVEERLWPRFDSEVNSAFSQLNLDLRNKVTQQLQSEDLYPDYIAARSTDSELTLSTRLMSPGELGGGAPPLEAVGTGDVLFSFHETLLNNALDRMSIAGKTMTEPEFEQLVNTKLNKFFPKLKLPEPAAPASAANGELKRIMFADNDPVRVKFENGNFLLIVRAGFERDAEHGGNIPPQIVTIPWTISVVRDELVMNRGDISTEPLTANENVARQLVTAGVIKSRLEASFPSSPKVARTFHVDKPGKGPSRFRIDAITLQSGWLSVRANAEPD
ncbi:MAG: hypothetical protein JWM11_1878 [Planctomycetaceae bacterium]|nr:hypothetical protein [Planctomycetaceae bacterium]